MRPGPGRAAAAARTTDPPLSEHWSVHAIWIVFILIVYGWVIVRLRKRLTL